MKNLGTSRSLASLSNDEVIPSVVTETTPTIKVTTEYSSIKEG